MIDDHEKFSRILEQTVESYIAYKSNRGTDIKEFIFGHLKDERFFSNDQEILEIVEDIDRTINRIDENHREIIEYKSKGLATSRWIEDKIDELRTQYQMEDSSDLPKIFDLSMSEVNLRNLSEVLNITNTANGLPLESYLFEDLNKKAVSNKIADSLQHSTLIQTTILGEGIANTLKPSDQIIVPLKEYMESTIDDARDGEIKKIVTTAFVKAKKLGVVKHLEDKDPTVIASIVDNGLTQVKMAYKIATGEINIPEAVDYLIDRTTARVEAVIKSTCRKAGGFVGEKVGLAIGSVFGPVGSAVGGMAGRVVGEFVGERIGEKITKGCRKVAEKTKEVCRDVYQGAKEFVSSAWSGVKSFFGR